MDVDEAFITSCDQFLEYPKNLLQHNGLRHSLKAYSDRLAEHSHRLFNEQPNQATLDFLDLRNRATGFSEHRITDLRDLKLHVRDALQLGYEDPKCRFIFLHAPNSRAPLRVSLRMFKFLFSYHQVMPAFLDYIFPFGKQINAKDFYFSGLRDESRFLENSVCNGISGLGRSGKDLRLCYNLKSVERSAEQPGLQWSIRQTAVYHELDTVTGRTIWIVVKGNMEMKKRITEAAALPSLSKSGSVTDALTMSFIPHLLLCEWAGENWRWYIEDLDEQLQELTRNLLVTTIDAPFHPVTTPNSPSNALVRSGTFPSISRASTVQLLQNSIHALPRLKIRSNTGFSTYSKAPTLVNGVLSPPQSPNGRDAAFAQDQYKNFRDDDLGYLNTKPEQSGRDEAMIQGPQRPSVNSPSETAHIRASIGKMTVPMDTSNFRDLQRIQYIEEKAQEAVLILKSNIEVLNELTEFYTYNIGHPDFPAEIKQNSESSLQRFERCVSSVRKDLQMLESRTETLLQLVGNRKALVNGMLQYRSAKASEASAERAEQSTIQMAALTKNMHRIAQDTKRETVSMRVITSVTLFFLPATFMATFMSTDILKFDDGKKQFSMSGLTMYLTMAVPLTFLTFLAWFLFYRLADRSSRDKAQSQDLEKGSVVDYVQS